MKNTNLGKSFDKWWDENGKEKFLCLKSNHTDRETIYDLVFAAYAAGVDEVINKLETDGL